MMFQVRPKENNQNQILIILQLFLIVWHEEGRADLKICKFKVKSRPEVNSLMDFDK